MQTETSTVPERYRLFATVGSPYALKLRALMRYKRLPFDWVPATIDWLPKDLPHPPLCEQASRRLDSLPLQVVPALYCPGDGIVRNESTAIAYLLDRLHPDRAVVPQDPGAAFLSHLIEDMADEWFVKVAFLRRWGGEQDATYKSRIVTGELLGGGYDRATLERAAGYFAARQRSRMRLVGCVSGNEALIDASFARLLEIIDRLPESSTFLFGASPVLADFGLYGQLQSLATDPTPWAEMRRACMGTFPYLQHLDDASGIEHCEIRLPDIGPVAIGISQLAAKLYLPYLHENRLALEEKRQSFSFQWDGLVCTQAPFKFHVKCLHALMDEFHDLPTKSRMDVTDIIGDVEVSSVVGANRARVS